MEHLAEGSSEYGTGFSRIKQHFSGVFTIVLCMAFLTVLPPYFGCEGAIVDISIASIAKSVAIYLGIPFALGILRRTELKNIPYLS